MSDKPTILVIDDTPENLSLVHGLLKGLYKVKVANNGERGLTIAQADPPPDLVLLDIMMPAPDGWEVCRRLKADERTRAVPVVFLTASTDENDMRRGRELGAVDYVVKPIDAAALLDCVKRHLG